MNRIDALDIENTELREQVSTLEEEKDQFEDRLDDEKREVTSLQKKLKDKEVIWIWASMQENRSSVVCEQQTRRPACASVQSDQCLSFHLLESIISKLATSKISIF